MHIVFVHQNMPAQYVHIANHFAQQRGSKVSYFTKNKQEPLPNVRKVKYELSRQAKREGHPYILGMDSHILYGQAVARTMMEYVKTTGKPDVICVHPGWGEGLFLRDVLPDTPILSYGEFYYNGRGSDIDFKNGDQTDIDAICGARVRNSHLTLSLEAADWAVSPTEWQFRQHPDFVRRKASIIHDGIRSNICVPDDDATIILPNGRVLSRDDEIVTYIARNLEPYRGFDVFMEAAEQIHKRRPNAHILCVGGDEVSYGAAPRNAPNWRSLMLAKAKGVDPERIYFTGRVPYSYYLKAVQVSRVHVYLTYPFVLSWSFLETMSCGGVIVGSRTPPVEEVLVEGENGIYTDFFNKDEIVEKVCMLLEDEEQRRHLSQGARRTILERYDLDTVCLPNQIDLVERVAARNFPEPGDYTGQMNGAET